MPVVICLKNRTFAVSQTSLIQYRPQLWQLWFAWKIVLLQYHKHPTHTDAGHRARCDLLEKSYFCSITNIKTKKIYITSMLWFAWKIVLLQYHKHLRSSKCTPRICCDLLEKSYFCSITNIITFLRFILIVVVICLKNRTFAVSQTSLRQKIIIVKPLWFAWKIVLLQYHKHQPYQDSQHQRSCDLLEKSYFCSITNINLLMQEL